MILKWVGIIVIIVVIVAIAALLLLSRLGRHKADKVKAVKGGIVQVSNSGCYIYGVKSGNKLLVFDGGIDEQGYALDALLNKLGVTRDQVTDVFLTHGHFDHVALVPLCMKARTHLGIADVDMAAHKTPQMPRGARWASKLIPTPAVYITDPLVGRAEFDFGGERLLALPLPGHTPGSYLFVWKGVLIAGDSIHIYGDKLGFAQSVFSIDLPLSRRGMAKLKDELGTTIIEQVCTGHEGCTSPAETGRQLEDLIKRASLGQN